MKNPNATLAAGSTTAAVILTWIVSLTTWNVPPAVAVAVAGFVTSLLLYIGRNGLKGLFRMVWRGSGEEPPAAP